MESVVRVKKSLVMPIRKLTSCVSGVKEERSSEQHGRRRRKRSSSGGGRSLRGCNMSGRTPPHRAGPPRDPSVIRLYQADLEKERKLREAMNTQKNAKRAAMRSHFRRKYQLSESREDANHLRSVGGKVALPHELSRMINPETKTKDGGFNLLSAFQGLSLSAPAVAGGQRSLTSTPTPSNRDSCRVM